MNDNLRDALKSLVIEAWSEVQDQENVLPMREWGVTLIDSLVGVFGQDSVKTIINDVYEETNEEDTIIDDDF